MSSVPPPPGGYPPYDPKTQWRIWREQQKAAWRAQRYAWRANYAGAYGPRVPSLVGPLILIAVGVVWLLIYSGKIDAAQFWSWYGRWWPLLLIAAGLALLGEWALDVRRATPVRRGGGFVWLLILLALFGLGAAGWGHMYGVIGPWNWNDNNNFFMFGQPEHDSDQAAIRAEVPANAAVDIENPRGDVSVTAGSGTTVEVQAHEIAYAGSDQEAQKIFAAEKAAVKVSGTAVLVQTNGNERGSVNLAVVVPQGAHVTINAQHGDVTADGVGAGVNVTAPHGDLRLNAITGGVLARFGKGDLSAHNVQGDITANGSCGDVTFSDIQGGVSLNCDYFNDMHMERIAGQTRIRTVRTDIQIAALPGDLTLNDDAMSVTGAKGQVRVTTHSRDVDLSQIYGNSYVDDSDGTISVEPAGSYGVEAHNAKGDVEITLPANASATVDGHTHNGDIVSDYPLGISGNEDKTVAGRIGTGTARIVLSANNGDVRIKRGSVMPPASPGMPASSHARHLKSERGTPAHAVAQ